MPRSGPRRRLRSECGSSPSPVSRLCPLLRAALPAELVVVLETAETPLHSPRAVRAHDGWFRQIRLETPTWLTAEGERTEDLRHGRDADRREGHCQPCVEGSAILAIRSYRGSAAGRTCGTPSRPRLAKALPRVEPSVEDDELANGLPPLKAYEAERGDEERAASITGCGGLRPSSSAQ